MMIAALAAPRDRVPDRPRPIVHRTRGQRRGFLTHLMGPTTGGELTKPFAALDLFEADQLVGRGFAPHPHSGIATLTTLLKGSAVYADSTGKSGTLLAGSVEWMRAGGGVWHGGEMGEREKICGYQLWIALPPALELAPAESLYIPPAEIPGRGPIRLLLGSYDGLVSPIPLPVAITYLHVRLRDGERWTYRPDAAHDVAWLASNAGRLHHAGAVLDREFVIFGDGTEAIELVAEGTAEFVIGSAARHPYPLVAAATSIHTSEAALMAGYRGIVELGRGPVVAALHHR